MLLLHRCCTRFSFVLLPYLHRDSKGQNMVSVLVQSDCEQSLSEVAKSAPATMDRKLTAALSIYPKNAAFMEVFTRLSDLADGFVRISHANHSPRANPETQNQWNIFECTNAILSIASAHGGTQFQRPPNTYPICYRKSSHQTTLTGPCALCIGVRSSLLTKSYCSQAGTW
jgi:hypothetical protein